MNEITPPAPIHSKLFLHIFFKLGAHGVHATSSSDAASPAHSVHPLANEGQPPLPASAAASARLAAILRLFFFGRRRGLEYLVLPLFTHTQAASNRVNEGERRGARECGFSASASSHPSAFPQMCVHAVVHLWTAELFFFFFCICSALTAPLACTGFCSGSQLQSDPLMSKQAVSQEWPGSSADSVLFLLPCLILRWNARSELFDLCVVDVLSGKGRGGMRGGDRGSPRLARCSCCEWVWTN